MSVSHVTTHILDTGTGRPASGVKATLEAKSATGWQEIASARTDNDGRIKNLGPEAVEAGIYRIVFETGPYFGQKGTETFFPFVELAFEVKEPAEHYHVPLLISPFAFSTYRGS
ncbi:hydroxyisourate hydrolase [Arthrobacter crystallopoietes]|jgi:5-hydroxyisourate hydrolase|uniref:5-hydroxyisourate hydrolase n=1 Tax=Arthrobacter mangrovi TaxID=2966350 RepID=A0ABQ5MR77_9MICC|nr:MULTISPECIES: hydroxyisourate hydrolase [Arthrobacter]GLB66489.1 5-hydroxyisourate hydrolase [Arthrobacter mangrovi]